MSGFEESLILVSDGMGEVHSMTVALGRGKDIKILKQLLVEDNRSGARRTIEDSRLHGHTDVLLERAEILWVGALRWKRLRVLVQELVEELLAGVFTDRSRHHRCVVGNERPARGGSPEERERCGGRERDGGTNSPRRRGTESPRGRAGARSGGDGRFCGNAGIRAGIGIGAGALSSEGGDEPGASIFRHPLGANFAAEGAAE